MSGADRRATNDFLNSGMTLIAAERHTRACYGFEIDPVYCDVIVARWERSSGQVAERVGDLRGTESARHATAARAHRFARE